LWVLAGQVLLALVGRMVKTLLRWAPRLLAVVRVLTVAGPLVLVVLVVVPVAQALGA